jgi:hypothetical protein
MRTCVKSLAFSPTHLFLKFRVAQACPHPASRHRITHQRGPSEGKRKASDDDSNPAPESDTQITKRSKPDAPVLTPSVAHRSSCCHVSTRPGLSPAVPSYMWNVDTDDVNQGENNRRLELMYPLLIKQDLLFRFKSKYMQEEIQCLEISVQ